MTDFPDTLCVVCCRGGSKGLPGKNIRPLAGKPLLGWTVEQAAASGVFADIAVSSDDDAILDVACAHGATLAIRRPDDLATDMIGTLPAMTHALRVAMDQTGRTYKYLILLQATSPLRLPEDIANALRLAIDTGAPSVVSATPSKNSPYYTIYEKDADGRYHVSKNAAQGEIARRQDTPPTYDLNGSIYVWETARYLAEEKTFFPDTRLYIMPEERSVDIDTLRDFEVAQLYMEKGLWLP